jgi:hypothetical protein
MWPIILVSVTRKEEMAKKQETELSTDTANTGLAVPAAPSFLKRTDDERLGAEKAKDYQAINRIGIVQPQSGKQRREEFGLESFVLFPEGVNVTSGKGSFVGIPLFFFPSWEKWSDYNDDESPTVIESVLNENHEIARRSKSKATRTESYGASGQFAYSYVESLNLVTLIDSGPAKGEIAVMSFNKSDHYVGKQIATMITKSETDIFARRIEFSTIDRSDGKNDWFGVKINNPTEEQGGVWITEDRVEKLKKLHLEGKRAYESNMIVINRDDETEVGGGYIDNSGSDDLPPI